MVQELQKQGASEQEIDEEILLFDQHVARIEKERAETAKKEVPARRLAQCTSVLLGDSLFETKQSSSAVVQASDQEVEPSSIQPMGQVWLFGRGDRRIDFIFSGGCVGALVSAIKFYSPVGAIVARPTGPCLS